MIRSTIEDLFNRQQWILLIKEYRKIHDKTLIEARDAIFAAKDAAHPVEALMLALSKDAPNCKDVESLGLVPTVFQFADDFYSEDQKRQMAPITITRMVSTFYEGEKWAVRHLSSVLGKDGWWTHEPSGSNRDAKFYAKHRFDTFEAAYNSAKHAKAQMEKQNAD